MHAVFSIFRILPGMEQGHPRTLYRDDVIRNTIGQVGSTIYVANDVLFIYHSRLTLHIYAIYIYIICISDVYNIYYILDI